MIAFFELTDVLFCTGGPVKTPVELSITAVHRRGYGSLYAPLNRGRLIPADCILTSGRKGELP